jgi:hypothetical protein
MLGDVARLEWLVHNAVYSRTRSGYPVSGLRPSRGGLHVYHFALPQAVGLSVQLAGFQNGNESRFRFEWTTPRADALNGMAKQFCFYVASAPAL